MDVSKFLTTGATLTEADLPRATQTCTIKSVDQRSLGKGPTAEVKVCLRFHEHEKSLGLNKTNLKRLAGPPLNWGVDSATWINRQVQLYRTWTQFKDDTVKCIRVWVPGQSPPEVIIDGAGNPAGLNPIAMQQPQQPVVTGSPIPQQPATPPQVQQQPVMQPFAPEQPLLQQPVAEQQAPVQPAAQQQDGQVTPPETAW